MTDLAFPFAIGRGLAMARAAEAMLRTMGGEEVSLRFAMPVTGGGDPRLGLAEQTREDVSLAPVVARTSMKADSSGQVEFVFAASAVQRQAEQRNADSGERLLQTAVGVVWQGRLFHICGIEVDCQAGSPYLYRVMTSE